MGFRLEAGALAGDLGVSITPVRDSLNRLVGEHLVDLIPGIGFHVPHLTEAQFRDLLDLNLILLLKAVEIGEPVGGARIADTTDADHAKVTDMLFSSVAATCGNGAIAHAVQAIGARLHPSRRREAVVLVDARTDIDQIGVCISAGQSLDDLSMALQRYHDTRKREAERIIAALARGVDG